MKPKAVGIVRVSQTRQRSGESFHSPKTQREAIERTCKANGLRLIHTPFEELDVSGTKPLHKRPGLNKAVEMVESGQANVIVVAYFDRLVRSLRTQAEVVERVEKAGGNVLAIDAGQITNGGAATTLSANMLGAVAQYQADLAREKGAEAQERAVRLGIAPWPNVPAGYVRGADKRYVPDPQLAPIILEAFERRAKRQSINAIRAFLAEHGIVRTYGGVVELLTLTAYVGEVRFGSLVNPKAHEPIVPRELFDRVQRVSTPRDHPKPPSERILARLGVLRCASCGARMVVAVGGMGNPLYRCPPNSDCPAHQSITARTVEDEVIAYVKDAVKGLLGKATATSGVSEAREALQAAQGELDGAIRAFSALTDEPAAAERLQELRQARDEAAERLDEAMSLDDALSVTVTSADWDDLTRDEQRDLIRGVIDRVLIHPGRGRTRIEILPK